MKIRKAVFPVAGLGTRFLPATKAMPKEMLPVVDKPLIQYAVEEAGHAKWLERLRDGLSSEELSAPANPLMLKEARKMLQTSVDNTLTGVKNLRDAYELTNELEHSETNAIFEFLIDNFAADKKTQDFLRSLLKDHIAKLMLWFPTQLNDLALDE